MATAKSSKHRAIEKRISGLEDEVFEKENLLDVMIPFADLMTLLLVFFVLFFIVSRVEHEKDKPEKKEAAADSLAENQRLISLPSEILFETGKAELKWEALRALSKAAAKIETVVKDENWQIRIEEHTDNVPIKTRKYESNWELSTARALSVVKFFIMHDYFRPDQLQAMGYGEFKPIVPNNTPKNRQKNRRVEIKLTRMPNLNNSVEERKYEKDTNS